MSKKIYNKLVRDKIPEIIRADGKKLKSRAMNEEEYLEALLEALGIEERELQKVKLDKAAKRGAFKGRIFLESVEG